MNSINVVDNDYLTLWYHPDKKIIHHKVKPLSPPFTQRYRELFRIGLLAGVDLMRDHNARKWLSDDRDSLPLPTQDVEWGERIWAPKAIITGWRYWAMVVPKDLVGQISSSNIITKFSGMGIVVKIHGAVDDAIEWLDKCG